MLELLQKHLAAFANADWDAYKADLAPDAVMDEIPTGKRATGADSFTEVAKFWKEAFPDAKATLLRTFETENGFIAEVEWEATHQGPLATPFGTMPATNKRVDVRAALIVTVHDGKIAEVHHYFDVMSLMLQLGAGRPMAPIIETPTAEPPPAVH